MVPPILFILNRRTMTASSTPVSCLSRYLSSLPLWILILFLIDDKSSGLVAIVTAEDTLENDCELDCMNGGECDFSLTNNEDGTPKQYCKCMEGFAGLQCEVPPADRGCPLDCQNGGFCDLNQRRLDEPEFVCNCPPDFEGAMCEFPVQECGLSSCFNGGNCAEVAFADGRLEYFCDCPSRFAGVSCEFDASSYCSLQEISFCVNGGLCREDSLGCVCPPHVWGPRCEYKIDLDPSLIPSCELDCQNGGFCVIGTKEYGRQFDAIRDDLFFIFETERIGLGYCGCPDGYTGIQCEYPYELCGESNEHICLNGSTCIQTRTGNFECDCTTSTSPTFGVSCEHLVIENDCKLDCLNGGECEFASTNNEDGTPKQYCECFAGFSGPQCEMPPADGDCTLDCQNGGVCGFGRRRYERRGLDQAPEEGQFCTCRPSFVGQFCETPVDQFCTLPCFNGGVCQFLMTGDDDDLVDDVFGDDALATMTCTCPVGFSGNQCETFDGEDCALECANGGVCMHGRIVEDVGGDNNDFCVCPPGFGGSLCELLLGDCVLECLNGGVCMRHSGRGLDDPGVDVNNEFCLCPDGFSGIICEVSECLLPCQNGGTCQTVLEERRFGGQVCECPDGFSGVYCGIRDCTLECQNGGLCKILGGDGLNQTCVCSDRYFGSLCENIACTTACQNGGICDVVVTNGNATERCACPPEYLGESCEILDAGSNNTMDNETLSPSLTPSSIDPSTNASTSPPSISPSFLPTSAPVNDESGSVRVLISVPWIVCLSLVVFLGQHQLGCHC